jgi:hypothetical protein
MWGSAVNERPFSSLGEPTHLLNEDTMANDEKSEHRLCRIEVDLAQDTAKRCAEDAVKGLEQLLASYAAFDQYLREHEADQAA